MSTYNWDVFISHATEDKETVVRPLAAALTASGLAVWYDEHALTLGDSLRRRIDEGLARSRYGVVVLSRSFFAKHWPQRELDGLAALEVGTRKVILPVWHGVGFEDVRAFSPTLADWLACPTSRGLDSVVSDILTAVLPPPTARDSSPGAPFVPSSSPVSSSPLLRPTPTREQDSIRSTLAKLRDTIATGADRDVAHGIKMAALCVPWTAGGNPRSRFSPGETILLTLPKLPGDRVTATEECRRLSHELFAQASADSDLRSQILFMIDQALAAGKGPFE